MSDLSREASNLLGAARQGAQPSAVDRARIREALVVRLGAITPAAHLGSSVPSAAATAKLVTKLKLIGSLGALTVAIVGAHAVIAHRHNADPLPAVVGAANAPRVAPTIGALQSSPSQPSAPEPWSGAPRAETPARPVKPIIADRSLRAMESPKATQADTVSDLALLASARQALAADRPGEALQELDRHAREYPASAFRQEREYTRIRALCQLGRKAEARTDAERFVRAWPSSMYREGIDHSCGGSLAGE